MVLVLSLPQRRFKGDSHTTTDVYNTRGRIGMFDRGKPIVDPRSIRKRALGQSIGRDHFAWCDGWIGRVSPCW